LASVRCPFTLISPLCPTPLEGTTETGRKRDQGLKAAAVQRKILNELAIDHCAHTRVGGVQRDATAVDRHGLADRARMQDEIQRHVPRDLQLEILNHLALKVRSLHCHLVTARQKRGHNITALSV
jgi:hypothetical protein